MKKELQSFQKEIHEKPTLGQIAADKITKAAGSWTFIISFLLLLVIWMALNVNAAINNWDPYPFILLNLVLSCLAAIQAPIILMSQNRQTEKDRKKLEYDYSTNRKAERGIEDLRKRLSRIESKLDK
jgi:uncharacterized membrane protein